MPPMTTALMGLSRIGGGGEGRSQRGGEDEEQGRRGGSRGGPGETRRRAACVSIGNRWTAIECFVIRPRLRGRRRTRRRAMCAGCGPSTTAELRAPPR